MPTGNGVAAALALAGALTVVGIVTAVRGYQRALSPGAYPPDKRMGAGAL